ncbi:putative transcription factor interactor and regulator CCHC(Zn) family [Rosa chinensis]|uniref:Putative transcription factor interactor and regulator CCHC(Zn) family n=1 Tax=Rosa chinensis TaxID=74649 RepID=A0A2P6R0W5_ROSCH|nr:putative transcription factor interactor and regulator CCHC(Zn) family [Rosa chinensis]
MDIVVGSKSSREAWLSLQQRFSNPSRANIMQLKIDLQTIKKGNDSIERYLIRVKRARYQLASVGVTISDEDIVVVTLNGLPAEYAMIKTVIRARDTLIPLENLRSQLLAAERDIEGIFRTHSDMSAMVTRSNSQRTHFYASDEGDNREKYKKNLSGSDKCNGSSFNSWPYNSTFQNNGSNKGKSFVGKSTNNWNNNARNGNGKPSNLWSGGGHKNYDDFNHGNNNWFGNNRNCNAECQICIKKGHTAVNCFYRNDIPPNHLSLSIVVCQICGLKGHAALDCHYRSKFAFQRAKSPSNLPAMFACNTN